MSETPKANNRLKNAVNSVTVPDGLAARIRNQIHAGGLRHELNERLRSALLLRCR